MKKIKLTKRISFLTTPEEFKEFMLATITNNEKYGTVLRRLMKSYNELK